MNLRQLTYSLLLLIAAVQAPFAQRLKITAPVQNDVSMMTRQAVIVNGRPGTPVVLYVNGAAVDTGSVRPDGVYDFLNIPVQQGPLNLTVVSLGTVPEQDSVGMHIAGEPASIEITSAQQEFTADGRSKARFQAVVRDLYGIAIPGMYFITLQSDTAALVMEDIDPNQDGIQARIENGMVNFDVIAPATSVVATISASWGAVHTEHSVEYGTPVVPLMIVGSADASATMLDATGNLNGLKNRGRIDDGLHSTGRLAFYGRGTVWEKYLLTASFDNERRQKDRLFRDLDPDVLYSIYGDNSTVDYTAQTSNPFFVKMERNRSFVLFGDFNTAFTQSELARYDRTFTGINGHYETKGEKVDVFATVTDRKVVQDEIRGQGISGYYFLGSSNVVPGSEKVRIETRDKRHNDVILNRVDRSRFGDYEIDYVQGTLFFKQPVASIDANGNPVVIVVSYESQSGFPTNYVTGVQAQQEIMKGLQVGVTAVTEERMPTNYTLLGFTTNYAMKDVLNAGVEVAHGSDVSSSGAAWKMELGGSPVEGMQLKSYFRKVESGFVNQTIGAGGASEIGSVKYGASGTYNGLSEIKLSSEFYHQQQTGGSSVTTVQSVTAGAERRILSFANLSLHVENLAYENVRTDTAMTEVRNSTMVNVKSTVRAADRVNLTAEYEQSISDSKKEEVKPSSAAVGAEYRVTDRTVLTAQQRFYIGSGSTTALGVGSDLGYGTTMTGRYEIGNGINGARNQASIGLKNVLKLTNELTSNLSVERTRALDRNLAETKTSDNDAVSLGLEYLPKSPYKASMKGEWAKNPQSVRRNLTFGASMAVANDLTLIEKMTYFEEDRSAAQSASRSFSGGTLAGGQAGTSLGGGLLKKFDNAIGMAFRPVEYDWLNAIGKFEKKVEFNGVVAPQTASDANIVSLHLFVEPIIGLEIGTKYAMKYATEESYGLSASTMTDLYLIRVEYDLRWNHFDVASEYRLLDSRIIGQDQSSSMKHGFSAEVGNVVFDNIRIAAGYNFTGTQEQDLVGRDYRSAGPFLSFRAKFTEKVMEYFNR